MPKSLAKTKNTWNNLSLTSRKRIKAFGVGVLAAASTIGAIVAFVPAAIAGAAYVTGLWAVGFGIPAVRRLTNEIKNGQKEVEWPNDVGQIIISTQAQQRDLQEYTNYLKRINSMGNKHFVNRHSKKMTRFNKVANKVTVKEDVEGGTNKFLFYPPAAPTYTFQPK